MDRGPSEVLGDIERTNNDLIVSGDNFGIKRRELAKYQLIYEQSLYKEQIKIYNKGKEEGKIPAEDMRKAMAHLAIDPEVWKRYLVSLAEVESLKKFIDTRQSVLTGLQSELQQMRVELTHA